MSGSITTERGYQWSEAPQDLIPALRLTAQPVARIDELAVTERELVNADVLTVAAAVPAPAHHNYTTLVDQTIAAGVTALVINQTVGGATTGQFVILDWPGDGAGSSQFLFSGLIDTAGHVKLYARNPTAGSFVLHAGAVIHYLLV